MIPWFQNNLLSHSTCAATNREKHAAAYAALRTAAQASASVAGYGSADAPPSPLTIAEDAMWLSG
jgi:hypothetical protein